MKIVNFVVASALLFMSFPVYAQRDNLRAEINVSSLGSEWSYFLINREPVGSLHYVDGFNLILDVEVNHIHTPKGWTFTDVSPDPSNHIITFYVKDRSSSIYAIAPGGQLEGFGFNLISPSNIAQPNVPSLVTSQEQNTNKPGPSVLLPNVVVPWPLGKPKQGTH